MGRLLPRPVKNDCVEIFVDGACSGNPGPGGWAALIRTCKRERERSGSDPNTTNNRMELMGAIVALEKLRRPRQVRLHSDSKYVIDGAMTWSRRWKQNGWRIGKGSGVKNLDLWQRLDAESQ